MSQHFVKGLPRSTLPNKGDCVDNLMFENKLEPLEFHTGNKLGNEVKISVAGLIVGMYVTRLDRSWMESTFPPQGMRINSEKQIEQIKKVSRFVYVDTHKGVTPDVHFWILEEDQLRILTDNELALSTKKESPDEYTKLRKYFYEITTDLNLELQTEKEIRERLARDVPKVLHDLQQGKPLDLENVKEGVTAIVDSIIRNPAAFNLITQLKSTDAYSYTHALGTSIWCAQFGRHLGLDREDLYSLALGGMLLDIGKIKIPTKILNKKTGFTELELRLIRLHVDAGVKLAEETGRVEPDVLQMIATHHERTNGSGYPRGLVNGKIPLFGRIAGIVDSYDAMTSVRPYHPHALTPHEAIGELYTSSDLFQPELVEQFIQTVGIYPMGSLVEFKSGQVGVVTAVHDLKRLYPTVMILLDKKKQPLDEFITIDLSAGEGHGLAIAHGLPNGAYGIKMDELFL